MARYKRHTRFPTLVEKLGLDPHRVLDDDACEVRGSRFYFNELVEPREVEDGTPRRQYRSVRIPPRVLAWWQIGGAS